MILPLLAHRLPRGFIGEKQPRGRPIISLRNLADRREVRALMIEPYICAQPIRNVKEAGEA